MVGRIAGIVNHEHNRHYQERRGFFGFFECINDRAVAHALFDTVRSWLAERNIRALRGPMNPSLNYEVGLLIEGFDDPPTFMMTYNPKYFADLIESYGFVKAHDLYAYMGDKSNLDSQLRAGATRCSNESTNCSTEDTPLGPQPISGRCRNVSAHLQWSLPAHLGFRADHADRNRRGCRAT